jgi:hypothetical protein
MECKEGRQWLEINLLVVLTFSQLSPPKFGERETRQNSFLTLPSWGFGVAEWLPLASRKADLGFESWSEAHSLCIK